MVDDNSPLTVEDEFVIRKFDMHVDQMSHAQAKEMLKFVHRHMVIQQKTYQQLIKHKWLGVHELNTRPTES